VSERDELWDFLLGEGAEPLHRDPALEAELRTALAVARAAAAEGWGVRGRRRLLRPALAAAAVLLVAVAAFLLNRAPPRAIYEPDGAFGALLPEETDSEGRAPGAPTVSEPTMRAGEATFSPLGGARADPLRPGDVFPYDSEVKTTVASGARIDLPDGAILFVGPLSTVRLSRHKEGGPALRLLEGVAATVAGARPLHVAVHETDLLLEQESGSLLVRQTPGEAIALRGVTDLLLGSGKRFRVAAGERLPAACVREPFTMPATAVEMDLEWYLTLQYGGGTLSDVTWEKPGTSEPLHAEPGTMLYLRFEPKVDGKADVSFGGKTRTFKLAAGAPLDLRLRLEDLGPGPRLAVSPAPAQARLFDRRSRPR
jgi:hypothetical protein